MQFPIAALIYNPIVHVILVVLTGLLMLKLSFIANRRPFLIYSLFALVLVFFTVLILTEKKEPEPPTIQSPKP
jgi:hypothetical protein